MVVPKKVISKRKFRIPKRRRILAISNLKGGVGKTTNSINLAYNLAKLGFKTLVANLDPQRNAERKLGMYDLIPEGKDLYGVVFKNLPLSEAIFQTSLDKNLYVIGNQDAFNEFDGSYKNESGADAILKEIFEELPEDFDFVIIDTPPRNDLILKNALAMADYCLMTAQPETESTDGITSLLPTLLKAKRRVNPALKILGTVIINYNKNAPAQDTVVEAVETSNPDSIPLLGVIPSTNALSNASLIGIPIVASHPKLPASIAYDELTNKILKRILELETASKPEAAKAKEKSENKSNESSSLFINQLTL